MSAQAYMLCSAQDEERSCFVVLAVRDDFYAFLGQQLSEHPIPQYLPSVTHVQDQAGRLHLYLCLIF
jgi:hypothetical protein